MSRKAPSALPNILNGADSNMFLPFLTPGLSLVVVWNNCGKGNLPFGPNVSGKNWTNVSVKVSSSPTSLRPNIAASPNPCAAMLADSFVNQGLLNNAPPANLVFS